MDEGASLFFVDPGARLEEMNIIGGGFVELISGSAYTLPTSFFLGVRTPMSAVSFGTYPPAYGWAEFENLGVGELVLVDHAVAYSGQGIVVGILTAIPEPGMLVPISFAWLLLMAGRRGFCGCR